MESLWSLNLFQLAFQFAADAHKDQKVPEADLPFITFISKVSAEVLSALSVQSFKYPNLAMQCALLHAVLANTSTKPEEIKYNFGEDVLAGVEALTPNISITDNEARLEDNLKRVFHQPPEISLVKMAERIVSLQIPHDDWSVKAKLNYQAESEMIYNYLWQASPSLSDRLLNKTSEFYLGLNLSKEEAFEIASNHVPFLDDPKAYTDISDIFDPKGANFGYYPHPNCWYVNYYDFIEAEKNPCNCLGTFHQKYIFISKIDGKILAKGEVFGD